MMSECRVGTGLDYMFAGATGTLPGYQWSPGGQLVWMRYPSGREVVSALDDAGRYRSVAKRVNGVETNCCSVTTFAANDGVRAGSFGPAGVMTEARSYTARLQAETIGYANAGGNLLTLTNHYCGSGLLAVCGTNNGNVMRQQILSPPLSLLTQDFG